MTFQAYNTNRNGYGQTIVEGSFGFKPVIN